MKKFSVVFTCLLLLSVMPGCEKSMLVTANQTAKKDQKEDQLLFVLHAKKGYLKINSKDSGTLSLSNVDSSVIYFTDRPNRKAGKMPTEEFVEYWQKEENGFKGSPPNSGFVFFENAEDKFTEVNIELTKPNYQKGKKRLTFNVTFLEDDHPTKSQELVEPVLFVDNP